MSVFSQVPKCLAPITENILSGQGWRHSVNWAFPSVHSPPHSWLQSLLGVFWNLATHRKQWKLGFVFFFSLSSLKGFSSKTHTHAHTHSSYFSLHPLPWGFLEIFSQKKGGGSWVGGRDTPQLQACVSAPGMQQGCLYASDLARTPEMEALAEPVCV